MTILIIHCHLISTLKALFMSLRVLILNTAQQNGVAERNNGHLLSTARALLFLTEVSKYLWGEVVLT